MTDKPEKKDTRKVPVRGLKMEIRSCDELRALLQVRIRAEIKDESLAKQLESVVPDIIAYGVGEASGDDFVV